MLQKYNDNTRGKLRKMVIALGRLGMVIMQRIGIIRSEACDFWPILPKNKNVQRLSGSPVISLVVSAVFALWFAQILLRLLVELS